MQTVSVKLSGFDVAQGFKLLSPTDNLDFAHHLILDGDAKALAVVFELLASEALSYSSEAQQAVDVIRLALNAASSDQIVNKAA